MRRSGHTAYVQAGGSRERTQGSQSSVRRNKRSLDYSETHAEEAKCLRSLTYSLESPPSIHLLSHFISIFAGIVIPDKNGPCLRDSTVYERTDGEKTVSGVKGGTGLCLCCEKRRESPEDVGGMVATRTESQVGQAVERPGGQHTRGPLLLTFHESCFLYIG